MKREVEIAVPSSFHPRRPALGVSPHALVALFELSASRMLRGRKLLTLSLLLFLPTGLDLIIQAYSPEHDSRMIELTLVFAIFPQALVPLTALVYATGMVQDELDEQTLTYLFIRPIPRFLIYFVKWLATAAITSVMTSIFCLLCMLVIHRFDLSSPALEPSRLATIAAIQSLAVCAYCSLFGLLSLVVRRTLVLGMVYLIGFEGVIANLDFVARKLTVMYYYRVMSIRLLDLNPEEWNIPLATAPSTSDCLWNLGVATIVLAVAAAWIFGRREFRVKTPEGN
ncbi:MAG: ABC transporter permease [Isosphaeraceae bacterium]|nr:ABC transporter permease [Isosphaeraceae bacterium]